MLAYPSNFTLIHGAASTNGASERLLLTAEELADLLGISRAHLFRLHGRGLLPFPIRLGRSVRWNRATVIRWLADGAPPRDRWPQSPQQER
jgi:excisionase family DNA binding protein